MQIAHLNAETQKFLPQVTHNAPGLAGTATSGQSGTLDPGQQAAAGSLAPVWKISGGWIVLVNTLHRTDSTYRRKY